MSKGPGGDNRDYRKYLREVIRDKGLRQGEVANKLAKSAAWLSQILNDKRKLHPELAEELARVLDLTERQRLVLLTLVDREVGNSSLIRNRAEELIAALDRPEPRDNTSEEAGQLILQWPYPAILELASCRAYRPDPRWVGAVLRPRLDVETARACLDRLREAGLLDEEYRAPAPISLGTPRTGPDPRDGTEARAETQAMAEYHRTTLGVAKEAVRGYASDRRNAGATLSLPEEDYLKLLERLEELFAQTLQSAAVAAEGKEANRVYQINLAAFPISLFTDSALDPEEVEGDSV